MSETTDTPDPKPAPTPAPKKAESKDPGFTSYIEGLKGQLANLKARYKAEEEKLKAQHDGEIAELEAQINPPKPVEGLTFGPIDYTGHSFVDGLPIKGTLNIIGPGTTKEGVYQAAKAANGNISRDGFSYSKAKP